MFLIATSVLVLTQPYKFNFPLFKVAGKYLAMNKFIRQNFGRGVTFKSSISQAF